MAAHAPGADVLGDGWAVNYIVLDSRGMRLELEDDMDLEKHYQAELTGIRAKYAALGLVLADSCDEQLSLDLDPVTRDDAATVGAAVREAIANVPDIGHGPTDPAYGPGLGRKPRGPGPVAVSQPLLLAVLTAEPMTMGKIMQKLPDDQPENIRPTLQAMIASGLVVTEGERRGKTYRLASYQEPARVVLP
jgi:hypothetical protein